MLPAFQEQRPGLLHLPPRDLALAVEGTTEKLKREEWVPLGLIDAEGFLVEPKHALDLARKMRGPWGQTQTVLLRCRVFGDGVIYNPMDGYHRIKGMELLLKEEERPWEESRIKSTVLYNCSDEELFDQRILAVNSVKSVKFSRLALWMKGAWEASPWKDMVTMTQAFGLATQDTLGKKLRLQSDDAEAIKQWALAKAESWLTPVGTIYQQLLLIDVADPYLVSRVRTGSFISGGLSLTQRQLGVIATAFPHEHEVQRQIATLSSALSYATEDLVDVVADLKARGAVTPEAIKEVMHQGPRIYSGPSERSRGYSSVEILRRLRTFRDVALHINDIDEEKRRQMEDLLSQIEALLDSNTLAE